MSQWGVYVHPFFRATGGDYVRRGVSKELNVERRLSEVSAAKFYIYHFSFLKKFEYLKEELRWQAFCSF